jgi:hypothetical protein
MKDDKGNFKYKSEEDLKKLYKEREIDIDEMEKQLLQLELKKKDFMKKLGESLSISENKKEAPVPELDALKQEIEDINSQMQQISMRKNNLLEVSLESQTFVYIISYATYLSLQKKEGDSWLPIVDSYEKFLEVDEKITTQAAFYSTVIVTSDLVG